MQFLKRAEALKSNNGFNRSQEKFPTTALSSCSKQKTLLRLLAIPTQKIKNLLPEQPTDTQQLDEYLRSKASSFTHQENKP